MLQSEANRICQLLSSCNICAPIISDAASTDVSPFHKSVHPISSTKLQLVRCPDLPERLYTHLPALVAAAEVRGEEQLQYAENQVGVQQAAPVRRLRSQSHTTEFTAFWTEVALAFVSAISPRRALREPQARGRYAAFLNVRMSLEMLNARPLSGMSI